VKTYKTVAIIFTGLCNTIYMLLIYIFIAFVITWFSFNKPDDNTRRKKKKKLAFLRE